MVQKILKHKKILYVTLSIIFVILVGVINFIYLSSNNHNILSNDKSIGLMYPSDYGYSVLSTSCARTTNLDSYSSASCGGQSWLYGKGYEWTLSPNSSDSRYVFYLGDSSTLYNNGNARNGFGHRPVLYLDSSVYKIDGDRSVGNPYIIGM